MPQPGHPPEAGYRSQCKYNLKQIGLALHEYHDAYGCFPPASIADQNGRPMHSWRVLILPYLDQTPLYDQYKFTEPWDGPNNSRLLASMPKVYHCPSYREAGTGTSYAAVFGPACVFRGTEPLTTKEITDGTSHTFIVGEAVGAKIPWMKPDDIQVEKSSRLGDPAGFSSDHKGGLFFLSADGAAWFVALTTPQSTIDALFTRAGGETVGDF